MEQTPSWEDSVPVASPVSSAGQSGPAQTPGSEIPTWEGSENVEDKYGTLPQQALTVAENLGKGYLGPVSTAVQRGLNYLGVPGQSPEEQAGRAAANPWETGVFQAVGLGAGILTGTGEAALLNKAGQGALRAAGVLSKPATLIGRAAAGALSGAVETSVFQAGDEVSKKINNPEESTAGALAHIGLGGLIGASIGGVLGPIVPIWAHTHGAAVEQGIQDFKGAMSGGISDAAAEEPAKELEKAGFFSQLSKQKVNAPELENIATRNDWPIAEGITSDSKTIQKAEDVLLNGPPTIASLSRQKIYNDIYDKVNTAVDAASSAGGKQLSETEAGNALKASMVEKLEAENAPIKEGYKAIEPYQQAIPVGNKSTDILSRNIIKILDEKNLIKGTERYNFVKTMADGISQVDNLERLKNFRTEVWRNSGPLTKDLAGAIADKLNGVEARAIRRYAETMKTDVAKQKILDVATKLEKVNGEYGPFKEKLKDFAKGMGLRIPAGPQHFLDLIDDMNPQKLVGRLFNEKNTEFASKFAEEFPEEMDLMRSYQRGLVREGAMVEGAFNAPKAIKQVLKMEPEMQDLLYSKSEQQVMKDADQYLRNFPKKFNPSGTDHTSAFRSFFERPTGAVIANLRDQGIQSFINIFGKSARGAEGEASRLIPLLGDTVAKNESNPGAFKHSVDYAMSAIKGENLMGRVAKSVFDASIPVAATLVPDKEQVHAIDEKLKDLQSDVSKHAEIGGSMGHYLPNHDIALKAMASNAANYVNSLRPASTQNGPLAQESKPTKDALNKFNRLLAIARQPMVTLGYLKSGTLTTTDVAHLKNMYPSVYANMSQKITNEMIAHKSKNEPIPYTLRKGLSTFLGQPMDGTLTQGAMQTIMMANSGRAPSQSQPQGGGKHVSKSTASSMAKVNSLYSTPNQARAASRLKP